MQRECINSGLGTGIVNWIVFVLIFIVRHIISTLLCFHLTS